MAAGRRPAGPGRAARPPSRRATRPAVAGPAPVTARTAPSRWLRIAGLLAVASALVVLLAPALRLWVAQKRQIQALEQSVAAQRQEVKQLGAERQAWQDPAYVKAQARERLKLVLPGDRAFTTLDRRPQAAAPDAAVDRGPDAVTGPRPSWFGQLWRSTHTGGAP